MHICYLCNEYPPGLHGGLGSVVRTLAQSLARRNHRVTVIGVYPPERAGIEDDAGVRVVRLPHSTVPSTGFLINGSRLRHAIRDIDRHEAIDAIEGPELSLAPLEQCTPGFKLIRMHGGHHFFSATLGNPLVSWRQWQERLSFSRADGLCAVSRFVAQTTTDLLHLNNRRVEILHNPVDTNLFRPLADVPEPRARLLFFGSICGKKGIRELAQAMPAIVGAVPEAELVAVGRDTVDPRSGRSFQQEVLEELPAPILRRIHFVGPVPQLELPRMIAGSTVCVLPSHMEAHSVACLEAMAVGKAVVAGNIAPSRETIQDGETGVLCDSHQPTSIADAVVHLLTDPPRRAAIGQAARLRVKRHFSLEVIAERNIRFYEGCLQRSYVHA